MSLSLSKAIAADDQQGVSENSLHQDYYLQGTGSGRLNVKEYRNRTNATGLIRVNGPSVEYDSDVNLTIRVNKVQPN